MMADSNFVLLPQMAISGMFTLNLIGTTSNYLLAVYFLQMSKMLALLLK